MAQPVGELLTTARVLLRQQTLGARAQPQHRAPSQAIAHVAAFVLLSWGSGAGSSAGAGRSGYSSALTISSHIFLASPNSIIVLSR